MLMYGTVCVSEHLDIRATYSLNCILFAAAKVLKCRCNVEASVFMVFCVGCLVAGLIFNMCHPVNVLYQPIKKQPWHDNQKSMFNLCD